jgi:hypothetical protein
MNISLTAQLEQESLSGPAIYVLGPAADKV